MADAWDEFPLSWGSEAVSPGRYIWLIHISAATPKDTDKEKPYVKIDCVVIEGDQAGYKFNFRLYITKAARGWATYFLKKFNYPEELLATDPPRLVRAKLEGLEGKILVDLSESPNYGLQVDAKGFDRVDGDELEKKMNPEVATQLAPEDEPEIDIFGDVKMAETRASDPLDSLDKL